MKIRNLFIALLLLGGVLITFPSNVEAGTYQCNPHSCNCGWVNYDCGTTQDCTTVCTSGYWQPDYVYGGSSWVCTNTRQDCTTTVNQCPSWECQTCYDTCCDELNVNPSQPPSISITAEVPVAPYQCNPHNCNCRNETYDCDIETCSNQCISGYWVSNGIPNYNGDGTFICTEYGQVCSTDWVRDGCSHRVCDTCYDTCTTDTQDVNIPNCSNPLNATLESGATVSLPALSQPATSNGVGYQFRFYDSTNTLVHTMESTSRTQTVPDWLIANINTGERYKIAGLYYTVNECDGDKKYSTPVEGCISGNNPPEPLCVGAGCTPSNFIQGLGSDTTTKGCESTTYTGKEINNPLHLNMTVTDIDGVDEIQGLVVWMSQDTSTPSNTTIDTNPQQSGTDDAAILIRKNGDWTNPLLYSLNTDNTWTNITNLIEDTNGVNILRLFDVNVTETTDVEFDFKLEFLGDTSGLSGTYNFYSQGLDTTLLSGNSVTHDGMVNIFDFGIDLVDPTLDNVTKSPIDQENITISWDSEDTTSGIMTSILNGYVSPASGASTIYLNALGITNPTEPADQADRGLFGDIGVTSLRLDSDETVNLDIGNNESGSIYVSITTYDNACNYTNDEEETSLDPWVSAKGGTFYSKEAVSSDALDVSSVTELLNKFQRFDRTTVTQGTELLTSRIRYTYQLIHPELNMVSATAVYDANNQKNYWFNYINDQLTDSGDLTDPNDACTTNDCVYKTTENIIFDPTFTCSNSTVYITEGDITISPQTVGTVAQNNDTGCIYIAKGDIYITNTGHAPTTEEIDFDYLEGFFIAEDQIIINTGTTAEDRKFGLEIEGGLVALGRDNVGVDGIVNNRTLKAYNSISPSLLVNYHPKYSKISQDIVGEEASIYIQEIGGNKN